MDLVSSVTKPLKDFGKNSIRLVKRCTKPDGKGECDATPRVCCVGFGPMRGNRRSASPPPGERTQRGNAAAEAQAMSCARARILQKLTN